MLVSTKGRYALRMMIEIAIRTENAGERRHVSLREIAESEDISPKYLEQLARPLVKEGLLRSVRGQGGGYTLSTPPENISAGAILRAVEGPSTTVACLGTDGFDCPRKDRCSTLPFWKELDRVVAEYTDSVSLLDLVKRHHGDTCAGAGTDPSDGKACIFA